MSLLKFSNINNSLNKDSDGLLAKSFIDFDEPKIESFKNQDYAELKSQCLNLRKLIEDPLFPANDSSISKNTLSDAIVWKRPNLIKIYSRISD